MTTGGPGEGSVVSLVREGGVAFLTLRRPAVLNAIDDRVCRSLLASLDRLEADGDCSVLVVEGEGRAFSAGADLTHMRTLSGEALRRFIELTWLVGERIARSPLVSLASIQGYALGGGAELALACDLRIAAEDAEIGFPEATLGSVPGSGAMQRLPAIVGGSRALEIVLDGRRVPGREAAAIGLVNRVTPADALGRDTAAWATTLATRPAEAIRFAKMCVRLPLDGAIAPLVQGLVSSACQAAAGYRASTERFAAGQGTP